MGKSKYQRMRDEHDRQWNRDAEAYEHYRDRMIPFYIKDWGTRIIGAIFYAVREMERSAFHAGAEHGRTKSDNAK